MIRLAARKPADNARLIVGEGADMMGLGSGRSDGPVSIIFSCQKFISMKLTDMLDTVWASNCT